MEDEYSIAKTRYKAIKKREYNYLLSLFIFEKLLNTTTNNIDMKTLISSEFASYKSSKQVMVEYNKFLQDRNTNKLLNDKINEEFDKLNVVKNKVGFKQFKNELCTNYDDNFLNEDDFFEIYKKNNADRCCGYCGISESDIKNLIEDKKIQTKRLSTRGESLEIDRIKPHSFYSKNNIILCCYWCNNAKTDEFELDEFEIIAKGINKVFSNRLGRKIEFPFSTYKQT
jgi:5-methylcytosine-specific restriction endonuclease McrA